MPRATLKTCVNYDKVVVTDRKAIVSTTNPKPAMLPPAVTPPAGTPGPTPSGVRPSTHMKVVGASGGTDKPFVPPVPPPPPSGNVWPGAGPGNAGTNIQLVSNPVHPTPPSGNAGPGAGPGEAGTAIQLVGNNAGAGQGNSGNDFQFVPNPCVPRVSPGAGPRSGANSPDAWPKHPGQVLASNKDDVPDDIFQQMRMFDELGSADERAKFIDQLAQKEVSSQIRKDPQQARMAAQYPERAIELEKKLETAKQHNAERAQLQFKFGCGVVAPAGTPPPPPAGTPPPPPPPPPADAPVDARKDASKDARKDADAGAPNVASTDGPKGEPVYANELHKAAEEREAQAARVAENFAKMEREREKKLAELRKQQAKKTSLQRHIEGKCKNVRSRTRSGSQKSQEFSHTAIKKVNGKAGQVDI